MLTLKEIILSARHNKNLDNSNINTRFFSHVHIVADFLDKFTAMALMVNDAYTASFCRLQLRIRSLATPSHKATDR